MKILKATSRAIQGSTLMIVVVITGLVGLVLAAYLNLLGSQNATTMRSQAWNAAIPVIEAGVEDALSHLNANGSSNLFCDNWNHSGEIYWIQRWMGNNYYIVTISNWVAGASNAAPTVESRGFVSSPVIVASSQSAFLADAVNTASSSPAFLGRGVRVCAKKNYAFVKGLVAKDSLNMNGNNVTTDSFDSADPNYSSNGLYDSSKHKAHGDVAVNSSILNSLSVGNANIWGTASTGPNGSVAIGPNGVVGDLAWHAANNGIEPGFTRNDMNVDFPDVQAPFNGGYVTPNGTAGSITNTTITVTGTNWSGATTIAYPSGASSVTTNYPVSSTTFPTGSPGPVNTTTTTNTTAASSQTFPTAGTYLGSVTTRVVTSGPPSGRGTWYDYNLITSTTTTYTYPTFAVNYSSYTTNSTTTVTHYDFILDSGNYQIDSLSGSVYVRGEAILYVTSSANLSGIVIKPGKSLKLYSSAPSVTLGGNDNGLASAFSYLGLPGNTSLDIGGNGEFTGTVYAPNAALTMHGGGNNTVDFTGASITKSVTMNGHFNFHYDEALGRVATGGHYIVTSWNEMSPQDVKSLPQGVASH